METKNITQEESLSIIQQMITAAKKDQKDDGLGWIYWGWMLFAASVFTFLNLQFKWANTFFFWNAFGMVALCLMAYSTLKQWFFSKTVKVKTYMGELFQKLNIGFFICVMFVITAINTGVPPSKGFPLLINLYGFWILIYGTALNFKPSIIGAYITWVFGFISLFVKNFEMVMVLHALAILAGYIIPGHMAYSSFKKQQIIH